jgi:hypothetical protein
MQGPGYTMGGAGAANLHAVWAEVKRRLADAVTPLPPGAAGYLI